MKHKKKQKKQHLQKKIRDQHAKQQKRGPNTPHAQFDSLKSIRKFIFHNLDFIGLLAIIILAVFANSLNGGFVSDDFPGFVNNPLVRDIPRTLRALYWQEIMYSLFLSMFELNPVPLHIVSVILHFVSVVTFFMFISNFFPKKVAMLSTVLFSVHPLVSEAVDWISAGNYLVFSITTFLSATLYTIYKKTKKAGYLITSVALFGFILITTKSVQVTTIFLVIIVVDQFLIEKKLTLKSIPALSTYLIPLGIFILMSLTLASSRIGNIYPGGEGQGAHTPYYLALPYSIFTTLRLMILPDKLTLYHDGELITDTLKMVFGIVFIAVIGAAIWAWKKNRKVAGLIFIGFSSFAYMLSPIQVSWFFAERYVYLATAMFAVLVALLFVSLEKKFMKKNLALFLVILLTLTYSTKTFLRNRDWGSRKSLWEATARVVPRSARTYNNLGDVYAEEGNLQASVQAFERAIQLNPQYAYATHNLGNVYLRAGKFEESEQYFLRALELDPSIYQAYLNLGVVEYQRANYEKAVEYANKTIEMNPNYELAHRLLAELEKVK